MTAILISTSRRPAQRVRTVCKELAFALPQTIYRTRGSSSFRELAHSAFADGITRLFIIDSRQNNPNAIKIHRLEPGCLQEIIRLRIVESQLRREGKTTSRMNEPSSIMFDFRNVDGWLQEKFLESFTPVLRQQQSASEKDFTFSINRANTIEQITYIGQIIDPFTDQIVSPTFKFAVRRKEFD